MSTETDSLGLVGLIPRILVAATKSVQSLYKTVEYVKGPTKTLGRLQVELRGLTSLAPRSGSVGIRQIYTKFNPIFLVSMGLDMVVG